MSKFLDVPNFFQAVYLVDLSPSLLRVAEDRFSRLDWKNVKMVCQDARRFHLEDQEEYQNTSRPAGQNSVLDEKVNGQNAELITMSYSLSMIPEFYPVIDSLSSLLSPNGVIGVSDFTYKAQLIISLATTLEGRSTATACGYLEYSGGHGLKQIV